MDEGNRWENPVGLFDKQKKPKEIEEINTAYDDLFDSDMDELADDIGFRIALEIIKKDVKKYVNDEDNEKTLIKFVNEMKPIEVIYSLMRIALKNYLISGEHHLYRGILTDTGNSMLKLYDYVIDWYGLFDIISLDIADEEKENIREDIKTVG